MPRDKTQLFKKKNVPVDVEIRISKPFCDYDTLNNNMQQSLIDSSLEDKRLRRPQSDFCRKKNAEIEWNSRIDLNLKRIELAGDYRSNYFAFTFPWHMFEF